MRIGNNMDMPAAEQLQAARTANYSKADIISNSIRLDITDIGKDTGLIIDQGRSMQDVIDEAGALDVKTQTDYMVVMSNTMSEEDYAKMCRDGFKPGEMTPEESVTILDHIKAVMAQSGEVVEGFNDDLDILKLEKITGSRVDANSLAKAMKQADVPINETNAKKINDAALNITEVSDIDDSAIRFMLINNQQPTIENVYTASFSAHGNGKEQAKGYYSLGMQGYLAKKADASDISSIMPDIEKTVEGFDLEDIDLKTGIKEATWLLERGLDLTKTNIEKLDELMNIKLPKDYEQACEIAAFSLARGGDPKKADLSKDTQNLYEKAADIIEKTEKISDEDVKETIYSGKILNLKNLWSAKEVFGISASMSTSTEVVTKAVSDGQAMLEEVRLKMTMDVNVAMLKRGIQIDTLPLSRLVDQIRSAQNEVDDILVPKAEGGPNSGLVQQGAQVYRTTLKALNDIPYLPAAVIGRLKLEQEYSLTTVHEVGTDMKARYEAAGQSYETLMTAPRKDMGDVISKAFRNVDDILNDMGLETDEANRKAVRILGYNSMEINEGSVHQIREATDKVMNAINAMTPARTLELIRQGINPMEMSIDELTQVLRGFETEEADEKYSRFLYKLDKSKEISESEREAFIGIYRLMNRLEKTDAAAIGALLNSEREITFKSLLSSMRSRKASFDESIDDTYGFLQNTVKKGISISDQIEQAFAGSIGQEKDERLNEEYLKEDYKEYMDAIRTGIDSVEELIENADPVTVSNMAASNALASADKNAFKQIKAYAKKAEDEKESARKDYDNALTDLIERFEDRDSAKKAYASVIDLGKQIVEDARYSAENAIDLKQMTLCHKQLSLSLARSDRENYTVPVEINGEMTAINLTLKHEDGAKGEVSIGFDTDMFGRVTVQFNVLPESISGLFVTQNKEGVDVLKRVSEKMSQKLDTVTDFRVIVGLENRTFASQNDKNQAENADINNMDTKTLYGLAKEFLKTFVSQM